MKVGPGHLGGGEVVVSSQDSGVGVVACDWVASEGPGELEHENRVHDAFEFVSVGSRADVGQAIQVVFAQTHLLSDLPTERLFSCLANLDEAARQVEPALVGVDCATTEKEEPVGVGEGDLGGHLWIPECRASAVEAATTTTGLQGLLEGPATKGAMAVDRQFHAPKHTNDSW